MTNATLKGKPDARSPHVRIEEGEVVSENPRRLYLLYKMQMRKWLRIMAREVARLIFTLKSRWCHFYTEIKFFLYCDEYHTFWTQGIPKVILENRVGSSIRLGAGLGMNNGHDGNPLGYGASPCILCASGGAIRIGERVGMSSCALVARSADIEIGSNTALGAGVKIYTSDFHSLDYLCRRDERDAQNTVSHPVTIGRDCLIGAGTTILKGVTIGDQVVIGACSVVTKSIKSGCIAAGVPCKILRERPVMPYSAVLDDKELLCRHYESIGQKVIWARGIKGLWAVVRSPVGGVRAISGNSLIRCVARFRNIPASTPRDELTALSAKRQNKVVCPSVLDSEIESKTN